MGSSCSQLGTADCVQGLLDDHRDSMNSESQVKLMAVLSKSYERLPSSAHRLMFLDVALLLRGRPAAHLTALWEGQLLLNEGNGQNNGLPVRQLPARRRGESHAAWQIRQHTAASGRAAELLEYLEKLLLVRKEFNKDPRGREILR